MAISSEVRAEQTLARLAPGWIERLGDWHVIEHILIVTAIPNVEHRCSRCSREARPGKKTCQVCASKAAVYMRNWRQAGMRE